MGSTSDEEPPKIGDWVRISILGSGGFGIVSLWRSNETNESIAVKKCKLQCSTSLTPKHKERWRNEVIKMKELNHPNLVKYKPMPEFLERELNRYNPTQLPLLPMEYCQKGNLRHILTQPLNTCGLEEAVTRNILGDISSAVEYLHTKNITHRDIKPENIVLQDYPFRHDKIIYKLIDLGYAKELGDATVSFVGTFHYLAPEILAGRNYDFSVDYWSLGVLAFEIVCGVLPYVPRLSPTERYRLIKEKNPEQICVFINHMGNIEYSSELLKENRISSCLKGHIENWLQKALQFSPKLRTDPFPNSKTFFQQLNHILEKKILEVFVVYKYQFYSYEFDEFTRLSTVRQWVARDTGIPEEEQLLLGNFLFSNCDDQTLIANCFISENYELFLFKRNSLFNIEKPYLPKLVKLMFNKATDTFHWHELKQIYSHSIHYIQHDITSACAFSKAMELYLRQLNIMLNNILKNWEVCRKNIMTLTGKVKEFNLKMKIPTTTVTDCVVADKFLKLYVGIEKCLEDEHFLALNINKWQVKLNAMKTINLHDNVIKLPQIKEYLEKATVCLKKAAQNSGQEKLGCGEMLKIVNRVMKLKDSIIIDENLKDYSRYLGKATAYLQSLSSWMDIFNSHIDNLNGAFESLASEAVATRPTVASASLQNGASWIDVAAEQNTILSTKFADLVTQSIEDYKTIREDIESYIQDISSLF